MKSIENPNTFVASGDKITLKDYYNSLPVADQIAPRKNLLMKVAQRCGVSYTTARSWFAYQIKPRNEKFLEIISEITGIAVEDMYAD